MFNLFTLPAYHDAVSSLARLDLQIGGLCISDYRNDLWRQSHLNIHLSFYKQKTKNNIQITC